MLQDTTTERVELSRAIHDTAAQSAYMIGLGIDTAKALAGDANQELTSTLEATSPLSRSIILELRHPINMGGIAGRPPRGPRPDGRWTPWRKEPLAWARVVHSSAYHPNWSLPLDVVSEKPTDGLRIGYRPRHGFTPGPLRSRALLIPLMALPLVHVRTIFSLTGLGRSNGTTRSVL